MVRIRYKHTAEKFKIKMDGHADYAPRGKDIVCASISTIAGMLLLACDEAANAGEIMIFYERTAPGYVRLCYRYKKTDSRTRYIAELVIKSYRELAKDYPENIQIESD